MATFTRPGNALKRAEELINVGRKQEALQTLHDAVTSRRYRDWQKSLERIMFKYVELCVDMGRGRFAKDGLIRYRILCQQVNLNSFEEVIKRFMDLATERVELALEEALDLEEADRFYNREFKFLWETYRTVLEILGNNFGFEALYAMTAHRAFQFCKQYKRTTEFRRLCEIIRNHLNKYRGPEILQLSVDSIFEQLKVAIEMELWHEAFRSVSDIYGLICLLKERPKPSLMVTYFAKLTQIFWVSSDYLYHGYAWLKLFSLQKAFNNNLSQKDLQLIASSVVLAALSVPPYECSHLDLETTEKQRNLKVIARLIGFDVEPREEVLSRSNLVAEMISKGVISCANQEVKDVYHLLENEVIPLDLASKLQPLLAKIAKLGGKLSSSSSVPEIQLSQYVPCIERLATLRLLQQASRIYHSMKIENLSKMISFLDFSVVEKISVDAVKHNFIRMKVDHMQDAVFFREQNLESDGLGDHLAESLSKARAKIYPPTQKAQKHGPGLAESVEKEHKRLLARKSIIEKLKEEQEMQLLEVELNRLKLEKITKEAEQRRLATEYEQRKKEYEQRKTYRIMKEIEERELEEAKALLEEAERRHKRNPFKVLGDKLWKQNIQDWVLRERQETKKLQRLGRKMDYLERARREEEAPLIHAAFQRRLLEEAALHEREQQNQIDISRQRHARDLEEKRRLSRMLKDKDGCVRMFS